MAGIADVDDADAAEALRAGVLLHALRATIEAAILRFPREEQQVLVHRDVVLLLRAAFRMDQARMEGIGNVPHREALEIALDEVIPLERHVGVHVVEIARLGRNELGGRPARRDEAHVPRGLRRVPPAGAQPHAGVANRRPAGPLLRCQRRGK